MDQPIRATIIALPGSTMMTLASVIDPLRAANRLCTHKVFEWNIVSIDGGTVELNGGINLPVSGSLGSTISGEYIIVVASHNSEHHNSSTFRKTLIAASRNFKVICGIEAGSWVLARCGLLEGRRATTHWEDLESLQQQHPNIEVCADRYVKDDRIWTCGGASPAFDMLLDIIELSHTPLLALEVASLFIYDRVHQASDQQPLMSLGRLERSEPRIANAVRLMERRIDAPLTTAAIADRLKISLRQLENLFRIHLNLSPGAYYLQLRLQTARKLVLDTNLSIQDIGIRTGFSSQSAFSRSFKSQYGSSPLKLRKSG